MSLKRNSLILVIFVLLIGAVSTSAHTPTITTTVLAQNDDCYYLDDRDVDLCYDYEYEEWYDNAAEVDPNWGDDCYYLEDDDVTVCYDVEWDFWYEEGEFFDAEDCYYLEDRDVDLCYFADEDAWYDDGEEVEPSWGDDCYELDSNTVCYDVASDWWYEEGDTIPDDSDFNDDWDDEDYDSTDEVDATYFVGENLSLEGDVAPAHQEIWDVFVILFPAERLDGIFVSFEIFSGDDGTVAYVYPVDESLEEWVMGYNMDEANDYPEEIVLTLVHEYAHVLSLQAGQFEPSNEASCATFYTEEEGCAATNSYIYAFYAEFWTGTDPNNEGDGRGSDYVSEYAMTNIAEDFAETFMTFVINDDRPTGKTGGDRKIKFMYGYPELVSLRNTIRANTP